MLIFMGENHRTCKSSHDFDLESPPSILSSMPFTLIPADLRRGTAPAPPPAPDPQEDEDATDKRLFLAPPFPPRRNNRLL